MPLTVLGHPDVNRILHSLTKEDVEELQQTLADGLHWYSTSSDANDFCSDFQPERTHVKRKDGSTTLYMPASSADGQGVKVVNIPKPDEGGLSGAKSPPQSDAASSKASLSTVSTTETARSSIAGKAPSESSASTNAPAPTGDDSSKPAIRGSLTLMDRLGNTTGLLNAAEVTAFRTALTSTMLLRRRDSVHDITVFGGGKQAYWHIRLALLLRGDDIHHLNIITRNFDTARECIMRIYNPLPEDPNFVNPVGSKYHSRTKTNILTPSHTEYDRLLKEYVRGSNVIFTTVPSTSPLFPASHLTNPEGRKKGRYICCIGSYKPHMIELHPDILKNAVAPHHEHRHFHKRQKEGGAVIVDTISGCMREAGEIIQAKLEPNQIVELGELFMLKREAEKKQAEKGGDAGPGATLQDDSGLKEWLTKGNVIYKCVGIGLMDIVVGNELVRIARERGVGTTIEQF